MRRSAELDTLPGNGLHLGARGLRRVKQGVDIVRFALQKAPRAAGKGGQEAGRAGKRGLQCPEEG